MLPHVINGFIWLAYLLIVFSCAPALWRLITGYRPIKHFDPAKAMFVLVAVTLLNQQFVRASVTYLPVDMATMMARILVVASIASAVLALFLTERAVYRAREP